MLILIARMVQTRPMIHCTKLVQFQYLINTIRPKARKKSKWAKRKEDTDIEAIQQYFGYNYQHIQRLKICPVGSVGRAVDL